VVPGYSVAADLALAARDFSHLLQISAPIPGANIMAATNPDQVFRSEQVVASGIYEVNDQMNDRFVFASLETARYIFGWQEHQVSSLVIKTHSVETEALKAQISNIFNGAVTIKTRLEQNAALYRMLNSENLFTYLFVSLIAAIAVFNLTGTLIMLVLEKKNNLRTLFTLGQPLRDIKRTFFASGLMMCAAGLALGLLLGVLVVLGQSTFGWVLITETLAYPVTLTWGNFLLVAATILGLGMLASFFGAQRVTRRLLD
jgi:lipoprotein-releasing system permease protein